MASKRKSIQTKSYSQTSCAAGNGEKLNEKLTKRTRLDYFQIFPTFKGKPEFKQKQNRWLFVEKMKENT